MKCLTFCDTQDQVIQRIYYEPSGKEIQTEDQLDDADKSIDYK